MSITRELIRIKQRLFSVIYQGHEIDFIPFRFVDGKVVGAAEQSAWDNLQHSPLAFVPEMIAGSITNPERPTSFLVGFRNANTGEFTPY